ncbi:hypothetical protein Acr_21g0001710 [Actinidia rufa]|uniref:Uncharacterized protein n=1 Tax=Actinidia rufa TaxID=165716 RepID=A0A7J0GFT2_9ERIC|nr:hypothetical protein Acr_21g0001710 [Actinidia rufa]
MVVEVESSGGGGCGIGCREIVVEMDDDCNGGGAGTVAEGWWWNDKGSKGMLEEANGSGGSGVLVVLVIEEGCWRRMVVVVVVEDGGEWWWCGGNNDGGGMVVLKVEVVVAEKVGKLHKICDNRQRDSPMRGFHKADQSEGCLTSKCGISDHGTRTDGKVAEITVAHPILKPGTYKLRDSTSNSAIGF